MLFTARPSLNRIKSQKKNYAISRFENIRETYRWNFLGSLHSLLAGKDPDIAFVDNSEGVDIFSMPYQEKRKFLTSIVSDYKKHSSKIQRIFLNNS